jgi:hypothetical protein
MVPVLLSTILSCNQVLAIANRLQQVLMLSHQQRYEILVELRKVVPTCPVIIHHHDNNKRK